MGNRMTDLVNKIERRLGTEPLNLPDKITKDKWPRIIIEDSLSTFSRFFPNQILVNVDPKRDSTPDGYCVIDRDIPEGVEILGVRDIDWENFSQDGLTQQQSSGYGMYDMFQNGSVGYGIEDAMMIQMRADTMSLYNNGFYIDYKAPNKIKIVSATGYNLVKSLRNYPIYVYIKHASNLMTISPTMMEAFEELALCDVARFLFEFLKHYDGLETVFANVDLKLDTISNQASMRNDIVAKLDESHVTASNQYAPLIVTI